MERERERERVCVGEGGGGGRITRVVALDRGTQPIEIPPPIPAAAHFLLWEIQLTAANVIAIHRAR